MMNTSCTKVQCIAVGAVFVMASALPAGPTSPATGAELAAQEKPIRVEKLANAPGKTLVTVNYAPGGKSAKHRHAGSVLAYVLSGAIRSENSATGPVKVTRPARASSSRPVASIL
jgi:quercetin dioxygenase-like cupin family protein